MLEKEIEAYFVKEIQKLDGIAFKFRSTSNAGVCDRIACLPSGEVWFVEIKQVKGKLSTLQQFHANDLRRLNMNYACLWSKEHVDNFIQEIKSK